jgi:hypothetical protein
MRVTKKVENYIREQVKAKVMPKYEAEKAESKRIIDIKKDIESRASKAAREAAMAVYEEAKGYGEFFELDEYSLERAYLNCYNPINIKNYSYSNSIYKWEYRYAEEVNKIVDDIIVTLELGGNKADLDRMLSEI